ncbi:DUF7660 family protein [Brevibacillus sp. JB24b]|uniref:DUF7660 family protein n=1 Tax=unclassified Brevibacillus TaxID=2684853 RepID=UPI003F68542B
MVEDLEQNRSQWANTSPADYLNGIASWIEDRYELMDNAKEELKKVLIGMQLRQFYL